MATNGRELSKYVTLVSSDGFEFVVLREAACVSGAIKRMLDPKSTLLQTPGKCMNDAPWLTPLLSRQFR
jgi:transcription elongation factor B subunit 1